MFEEIQYRACTIELHQDENPESPREWDNFGTMVCFHRRYVLGDKHNFSVEEIKEIVQRKDVLALPLFLYDHSGLTMNTTGFSCPWDSGQVGYIFVEYSKIKGEFSKKRVSKSLVEKARRIRLYDSRG